MTVSSLSPHFTLHLTDRNVRASFPRADAQGMYAYVVMLGKMLIDNEPIVLTTEEIAPHHVTHITFGDPSSDEPAISTVKIRFKNGTESTIPVPEQLSSLVAMIDKIVSIPLVLVTSTAIRLVPFYQVESVTVIQNGVGISTGYL